MKNLVVLDNNGETFDRYTIIEKSTGEMIGASANPFHPQGFGQYSGNIADNHMNVTYGYSWRKRCNVRACIRETVKLFLNDCSHIGKKIPFESLPLDVQKYAKQAFKN